MTNTSANTMKSGKYFIMMYCAIIHFVAANS